MNQASACFILSVNDTMPSIQRWIASESEIFRGGSGAGVNLSRLRGDGEALSNGGQASGPVSFMRWADSGAGSIKSGGGTRRAAKMVILDGDHPDILEFVRCKAREEAKAYALGDMGYDLGLNGEAWRSIQFQNANNSVRLTDDFFQKADAGEPGRPARSPPARCATSCPPRTCCARSPRRRGRAATRASSTRTPSSAGTRAPTPAASPGRTRAPSTCTSTTRPATWPRST